MSEIITYMNERKEKSNSINIVTDVLLNARKAHINNCNSTKEIQLSKESTSKIVPHLEDFLRYSFREPIPFIDNSFYIFGMTFNLHEQKSS